MSDEIDSYIDRLLEAIDPLAAHLQSGRERQAAVFEGRESDFLPIIFNAPVPESLRDIPDYNYEECYHDARKMLVSQLKGAAAAYASGSDAVPSMRTNHGTGIVATVLGAHQEAFPDKMPWVTEHVSKDRIAAMTALPNVEESGVMPLVAEHLRRMVARVQGRVPLYVCDTQGPFDIAHLVLGDDLFTELYDDPPFVEHLLRLCTEAYIAVTEINKRIIGEPRDGGAHGNSLWMSRCGARACEDSTTLVSREHVDRHAMPHLMRAIGAFGGGWVHYCGNGRTMLDSLLASPEVKALNFGNAEMHDPARTMKAILDAGKVYFGGWPREEDEPLPDFYERVLRLLGGRKRGLIFCPGLAEAPFDQPQALIEQWHKAHHTVFGG